MLGRVRVGLRKACGIAAQGGGPAGREGDGRPIRKLDGREKNCGEDKEEGARRGGSLGERGEGGGWGTRNGGGGTRGGTPGRGAGTWPKGRLLWGAAGQDVGRVGDRGGAMFGPIGGKEGGGANV